MNAVRGDTLSPLEAKVLDAIRRADGPPAASDIGRVVGCDHTPTVRRTAERLASMGLLDRRRLAQMGPREPGSISPQRRRVLGWIAAFVREHGRGPHYREIMVGVGYRASSSVHFVVSTLARDGFVGRPGAGQAGGVSLTPEALASLEPDDITFGPDHEPSPIATEDDLEAEVEALVANPIEYERRKAEAREWFHRRFVIRIDSQRG